MSVADPIEDIWQTFHITMDALRVALRAVRRADLRLLRDTHFIDGTQPAIAVDIEICRKAASDYAILSMWAIFERRIIAKIEAESRKMLDDPPSSFNDALFQKIEDAIEYWRTEEVLDLIKPLVGGDLVGNAKQIKKYRDWMAHKNPKKPSPANVTPEFDYRILSELSRQLAS
jgi:hypothetical protein